uniref:Lipid-binding serum glycoprotein N-terminal domain-containing protein n=1 Tax=Panagrolaimus superbus TaxID=310955 RepID=A0A914Z4G7_9BILA
MRWIFAYFVVVSFATAQLNIPNLLINEKPTGISGVKSRISPRGVKYVASFLTNSLLTELVTVSINTAPQNVKTSGGNLIVNDMILGIHHAPDSIETSLMPPNAVYLEVKNINISSKASLSGGITETAIINAPNAHAQIQVAILKTSLGAPNLRIMSCKLTHNSPVTVQMSENLFKNGLVHEAPELLQSLLCSRIEFLVEERINARFGLLSPKIPLANVNEEVIVKDLISKMLVIRRQRYKTFTFFLPQMIIIISF